ncbi:MAG: cobalamin-binding protein [Armatimonadetes bacterium]|nr:cobalamin-binding protein [Armatimonadota bacterium]
MSWKRIVLGSVLLLCSLDLFSCRSPAPLQQPAVPGNQRLISLAPNLTEILFALGVGDRVLAVTGPDDYPPEVKELPRVGGLQLDYERLIALKPDQVLADSELNGHQLEKLRELRLPVQAFQATDLPGLLETIVGLGAAVGAQEQALALRQRLERGLSEMERQVEALPRRPTVFVEIWAQPLMTAGSGSYVGDLVERSGGINVFADLEGYPRVTDEQMLVLDPEVIVLTVSTPEEAAGRPGWHRLKAVKEGAVHRIDSDLLARPSPRVLEALGVMHGWFRARVEKP